jgi:hypothetical protein
LFGGGPEQFIKSFSHTLLNGQTITIRADKIMKSLIRKGYENYEEQLEKALGYLSEYLCEEIERRTDGSFYLLSLKTKNTPVKSIRVYHEFIEQQLIVTLQIGEEFKTTLELNTNLHLFKDEELKPEGDDYLNALQKNAQVIKKVMADSI